MSDWQPALTIGHPRFFGWGVKDDVRFPCGNPSFATPESAFAKGNAPTKASGVFLWADRTPSVSKV
ncbi:MAG: hypothetical protein EB120_09300 [Proteobacteria bacterium]|nr:hypothetical protein [Pseudomonadota bacterium]